VGRLEPDSIRRGLVRPTMTRRSRHATIEPLFTALEEETPLQAEDDSPRAPRSGLRWKLFWAAIVLLGLIALVVKQAF